MLTLSKKTFLTTVFRKLSAFTLLAVVSLPTLAAPSPVDVRNNVPVIGNMLQGAAPSTNWELQNPFGYKLDTEISNYFSFSTTNTEGYNINGETLTIRQSLYLPLTKTIRAGLVLPFVRHSGGKFDSAIYNFHDFFGMPQNGRTKKNSDSIYWSTYNNNERGVSLYETQQGLGDVELFTETKLKSDDSHALRLSLKLPTGSKTKYTGNGAFGLSAGLGDSQPSWFMNRSWLKESPISLWYAASITYNERVKQMSAFEQYNFTAAALVGLSYAFNTAWQIKTQFNTNTPYFDSRIRELGWVPVIFSVEALYRSVKNIEVGLRISEDLRPRVTPDFSLGLVAKHTY